MFNFDIFYMSKRKYNILAIDLVRYIRDTDSESVYLTSTLKYMSQK